VSPTDSFLNKNGSFIPLTQCPCVGEQREPTIGGDSWSSSAAVVICIFICLTQCPCVGEQREPTTGGMGGDGMIFEGGGEGGNQKS